LHNSSIIHQLAFKLVKIKKQFFSSFERSCVLVTQVKDSLQTTGSASQLLKIQDQYECLVQLIETMQSAKYTIKGAVQAIQKLDFIEDTCNIRRYNTK